MHQIWLSVRSGVGVGLVAVLPLIVILATLAALRHRFSEAWRRRVRVGMEIGAVVVALGVIAAVTLAPSDYDLRSVNLMPFRDVYVALRDGDDVTRSLINCAGNAVLFLPLGAALALSRGRSFRAALVGVTLVSLLIETLQYAARLGRVADVTDVAVNVAGAVAGWLLWALVRRVSERRRVAAASVPA